MNELLARAIMAHGSLERWERFSSVTADLVTLGQLWTIKGIGEDLTCRHVGATLHSERLSVAPFGQSGWQMVFTPDRVVVEDNTGSAVAERRDPRASFARHQMNTPWDPLHRAYFNGYALWTYLTTPFLLTMRGFEVSDIEAWRERNEIWRGVRARFPPDVASHCPEQDFYFGPDFLLRRHDYRVDVAGGFAAAHYVSDYIDVDGVLVPTTRRAYLRDDRLRPIRERLMIGIDFTNVRFHLADKTLA